MQAATITAEELERRLSAEFPEMFNGTNGVVIEAAAQGASRVRQVFHKGLLRPGGTIAGPTMMMLSDVAMYVAVLSAIGWVPLAVTNQLNIHFLRKPDPVDLIADGRILKLGKRLAVGEVTIRSEGVSEPVSHATLTYSIPSSR
ncbi:MAG: PaaI family thioesterase [Rhizobiales bacterium]|jgi:acyl-coenzyme A thioesterase PaaI-like protein|nr:PaaI family thioesterase [Hyphomicrobiales bacterium]